MVTLNSTNLSVYKYCNSCAIVVNVAHRSNFAIFHLQVS